MREAAARRGRALLLYLCCLSLAAVSSSSAAALSPAGKDAPAEERFEDLDLFGAWLFTVLDESCSGSVPLLHFAKAVGGQSVDRPRQLNWLMGFDASEDGQVTAPEVGEGFKRLIQYQVDRFMAVDANGDAALSASEYALSYAGRNGEDQEAAEKRLALAFARLDLNGDGRIVLAEAESVYRRNYISSYWARAILGRLRSLDVDGDEQLQSAEIESGLSLRDPVEVPADGAGRQESEISPLHDALGLNTDPVTFRQVSRSLFGRSVAQRFAIEALLQPILSPDCSASQTESGGGSSIESGGD